MARRPRGRRDRVGAAARDVGRAGDEEIEAAEGGAEGEEGEDGLRAEDVRREDVRAQAMLRETHEARRAGVRREIRPARRRVTRRVARAYPRHPGP